MGLPSRIANQKYGTRTSAVAQVDNEEKSPNNVKNLEVAWIHMPGRSTRGLQTMPLVADGVLYYSGSYSRVYALDGATGKMIWSYFPHDDEELVSMQTHTPDNRGVALGDGKG